MLNDEGNKCCLGFFAAANGATNSTLLGEPEPEDVTDHHPRAKSLRKKLAGLLRKTTGRNNAICIRMMELNDSEVTEDSSRETKLTKMFAKLGWKPKFID